MNTSREIQSIQYAKIPGNNRLLGTGGMEGLETRLSEGSHVDGKQGGTKDSIERISVIIPAFNSAAYLAEALKSVLNQSAPAFEVIVVDDGSIDDTPQCVSQFIGKIRYIRQENMGVAQARNRGIREAKGTWIAFLDADDVWHPHKLALQRDYLERHPEVDLLASSHLDLYSPDSCRTHALEAATGRSVTSTDLVLRSHFGICGVLVRKTCLDVVGGFNPNLRHGEDRELWIRIADRFVVHKHDLPLWWYRWHEENASLRPAEMTANHRRLLQFVFEEVPALRGRLLLRQKALSRAAYGEAIVLDQAGQGIKALSALLRSYYLWPVPYCRDEVKTTLARVKTSIAVILHLMGKSLPSEIGRFQDPQKQTCVVHGQGELTRAEGVAFSGKATIQFANNPHAAPLLAIGKNTICGQDCVFHIAESVQIGTHCLLAYGVVIQDYDVPNNNKTLSGPGGSASRNEARPVILGNNVWVGSDARIQKGVTIGDHSIVMPRAVVTDSVPANVVVAGNPARIVSRLTVRAKA